MKPETFANVVASTMYEKRFGPYFIEPVIAGLNADGSVYLCATDLIGAKVRCFSFLCWDTCLHAFR